ncbi:type II toxin-antitoxin system RelE/ParE family toxin [candidate division KSB1 bacterium]|nr:type II toxin-antitoxin system RelE/ParE family toxin [candidate division KSB1 bacterium]
MKIIWTVESLSKLNEIEAFIARDSLGRAKTFRNYLIECGESISRNPMIGRVVPEILNPFIRELIVKNYRIIYRLKETRIEILTVHEAHRLLRLDEIEIN